MNRANNASERATVSSASGMCLLAPTMSAWTAAVVALAAMPATGQRDDLDAGQDAAQQIDRLADAALKLILDLDLAWLRWRHGTIVSPGRPAA